MFKLVRKASGTVVTMRDGSPFTYTSKEMARLGKSLLQKELDVTLIVVEA